MADSKFFNLLKPVQPPKTYWDKIYDWILYRARIVLLIVEITVVVIFFVKIFVDNTARNKIETFDRVQANLLSLSSQYERQVRQIQNKDNEYVKLWNGSSNIDFLLDEIYTYLPNPTNQLSITVDSNVLVISGADLLDSVTQFEQRMKNSETFQPGSVIFRQTRENSDLNEGTARFTLEARLKEDFLTRTDI